MKTNGFKSGLLLINNLMHFLDVEELSFDADIKLTLTMNFPEKISSKLDVDYWKEIIGTFAWERVYQSKTLFEIIYESNDPKIQNHENENLRLKAKLIWCALRLLTPVHTTKAFITSGYYLNNKIRVNHYEMLPDWCMPEEIYCKDEEITKNRINKLKELYVALKYTWERKTNDHKFERFWRGVKCFQKACDEFYAPYRFPNFVRSLEALIIPEMSNTAGRFTSRPTKWWPKDWNPTIFSGSASEVLGTIYQIRCDLDHLHDPSISDGDLKMRSYQVQQIARKAFQDILLNPDELKCFETDQSILDYWEKFKARS